jgi:hypothetical protein
MEDMSIKVLNRSNEEVMLDVLYTFVDVEKERKYIIYTDYTLDKEDNFKLYSSEVVEKEGKFVLLDILDKRIKEELKNILKSLSKQLSLEEYL